jgi:hypothetical protein
MSFTQNLATEEVTYSLSHASQDGEGVTLQFVKGINPTYIKGNMHVGQLDVCQEQYVSCKLWCQVSASGS